METAVGREEEEEEEMVVGAAEEEDDITRAEDGSVEDLLDDEEDLLRNIIVEVSEVEERMLGKYKLQLATMQRNLELDGLSFTETLGTLKLSWALSFVSY